jgi:hypothetical protein
LRGKFNRGVQNGMVVDLGVACGMCHAPIPLLIYGKKPTLFRVEGD